MTLVWALLLAALLQPAAPPAARAPGPGYQQLLAQATAARESNDVAAAIPLYRKLVRLRPAVPENWWFLATLLYDTDRYPEARDAFRKLVARVSDNGPAWALLGLCEFQTKEYPAAGTHLETGLRIGVDKQPQLAQVAHYHYALLLTKIGEFERASAQLFEFARAGKDDPSMVMATGIAALRKPLLPAEVPEADRELVLQTGRAVYDAAARKAEVAQKEMEALVARYPAVPNIHYIYGSYLMFSDPDRGLKELRRELEISPAHVPARVGIVVEYLKRGEPAAALPYARDAVELAPKDFVTHTLYGRVLVESGDVKPGVTELELAAKLAPDSPQTRVALAAAYAKAGRKEDAARERAVFLKLKSESKSPGEQ